MKLHKQQSGFGHIGILAIILSAVVIGAAGWFVYDHQHKDENKTPKTQKTISSFDECVAAGNPTRETYPEQCSADGKLFTNQSQQVQQNPEEKFVEVIQSDDTIQTVGPSEIAKTDDQKGVLIALHKSCTEPASFVLVNHVVFDGNGNYKQDGNYAYINSSCASAATDLSEIDGSGSAHLLHKTANGTWNFDFATQMAPPCSKADGLGYPASIIPLCYESDGTTTRAPK
jgi:hypothetical protein